MPALPVPPRLALLAITGVAALSVFTLSAPAPAYADGDVVVGPIDSVTGNSFQVSRPNGNATVGFTDSTAVSEAVPAQLGEVTVGSCIKAGPTPESTPASSGAMTAKWVMISTAVDGKCPQRAAADGQHHGVRGIVNSVAGNTVTVTGAGDGTSETTVTVTDTTHYRKRVPTGSQAITAGKCVAARGATDAGGVLQATRVTVWAATNGPCPQPGD